MTTNKAILSAPLVLAAMVGCAELSTPTSVAPIALSVTNQSQNERTEETITLPLTQLRQYAKGFDLTTFSITKGNQEIPSQAIDSDGNGTLDGLVFNAQLKAGATDTFTITSTPNTLSYPKRTHAEISINQGGKRGSDGKFEGGKFEPVKFQKIPEGHTPGDLQFRFEGPGWESDKIAYRLYFDHRNVNDIFGKKVPDMVLPQVGHIGYSYHKEADWGMDILKVGPSLGIGGIGMRVDGEVQRVATAKDMSVNIVTDGNLQSHIQIKHDDWRIAQNNFDLTNDITINAGSRMTHSSLTISPVSDNLVTGIVKHQPSEFISSSNESGDWAYIATFGKQSYVHDELGMAILYKKSALIELSEDKHNHLVTMKPQQNGKLDYYFLGSWAQDSDGMTTKAAFTDYLNGEIAKLNQPLHISAK